MIAFFRSLLAELLPQKPKAIRRRAPKDRRPAQQPKRQEPVPFGRRGNQVPKRGVR